MTINNLCFIADDYPSQNRMVFVFVQQLVEALVDDGVKVSVVAPQSLTRSLMRGVKLMPRHQTYATGKGNPYDVYRPYALSFSSGNKALYKWARSFNQKRVLKCLDTIDPQILYGHFWHNAMKVANYAEKLGKPLFVACGEGDNALEDWGSRLKESAKEAIRRQVNGVISVSTENKRKCLSYGLCTEENITVLPNCVNDSVFHPIDSSSLREKLGAKHDDFVVSYTGAFIDRKGYNRLSSAIDNLGDERIKVIFCGSPMAGHEKDIPHCKNIIHCGAVNHDDLPKYLCASDLFVLPTLKEGCCNAIVEALACGVPVVSSNQPFNDDILNENNSLRIDTQSVEQIMLAIKRLVDDPVYLKRIRQYTLSHSSNYSIASRAKRVISFIEEHI